MSGHSKWSQIKRQKGVTDARRGQLFTKIAREIEVAARTSGPDPQENSSLRMAIARARQANMPKDNVERAIKRAVEAGSGSNWHEVRYEAYGPGGVALIVDALTDNRNRTVADIRSILTKAGGNMGETGSVNWLFEQKGVISIDGTDEIDLDVVGLQAIDAGAEDVEVQEGLIEVLTSPQGLEAARVALEAAGVPIAAAEVVMRPTSSIALDTSTARIFVRLLESLEELDDVQRVHSNADLPDSILVMG